MPKVIIEMDAGEAFQLHAFLRFSLIMSKRLGLDESVGGMVELAPIERFQKQLQETLLKFSTAELITIGKDIGAL